MSQTSARVAPDGPHRHNPPGWGQFLSEEDYATLSASWITREIADEAMLRRVDSHEGREVVCQKGRRDFAGILIPYYWPGDPQPFNYRLRRDNPEMTQGKDGELKRNKKYLAAPGSGNRLYIPPGVTPEQLADVKIPIAIVEGEKKALALWRLAWHEVEAPRFIPIAIPGVWSWLGKIGKTGGPRGERLDVKGPILDLSRISWQTRKVFIVFDTNVHTNEGVKWARNGLSRELATREAQMSLVNLPPDCGVNGVDDLLAAWGPSRVLELFDKSVSGARLEIVAPPQFKSTPEGMFRILTTGEQLSRRQLTTYQASIKTSITLDDGVETKREFEMQAELNGRRFLFTIPAAQFASMDWPIEQLGPGAITFPNQREYARTAIQASSLTAEERSIYTHSGWREVDGTHLFLHANGAIGGSGLVADINVRLGAP